ncbi:TPA: hypothetical protein ACGAO6_002371 [Legionella pneumophila]
MSKFRKGDNSELTLLGVLPQAPNKTEPNWKYDATTGVIPGHVVDKAAHKLGADNLSERYFNGEK